MSANRIFLVCAHHPSPEDALLLGERAGNDVPYFPPNKMEKRADAWFTKHMACGRGSDHFKLGYGHPQDWDCPLLASDVGVGVRMSLLNGGDHAD